MRLHLVIERNGLPVTRVLWTTQAPGSIRPSLTNTASSYSSPSSSTLTSSRHANRALGANASLRASGSGGLTIAQLLEDIHNVIPLQSDDAELGGDADDYTGQFWTLEDYVVEVGGSECLHFMEVDGILREEDEVVIRPLQPEEIHARKATGRMQITADGWHLIDGIPFGYRFTQGKRASRPPVRIPFRKKRRLMYEGLDDLNNGEEETCKSSEDYQRRLGCYRDFVEALENENEAEDDEDYEEDYETGEEDHDEQEEHEEEEEHHAESDDAEMQLDDSEAQHVDETHATLVDAPPEVPHTPQHRVPEIQPSKSSIRTSRLNERDLSKSHPKGRPDRVTIIDHPADGGSPVQRDVSFKSTSVSSSEDEDASASLSSSETLHSSSRSSSIEDTRPSAETPIDLDQASYSPPITRSRANTAATAATKDQDPAQKYTPPGAGSKATKYTNTRSKMRRKLNRLKAIGFLGESANFNDLRKWEQENPYSHLHSQLAAASRPGRDVSPSAQEQASQQQSVQESQQKAADEQAELEVKRARLLEAIQSGGVDVDDADISRDSSPSGSHVSSETLIDKRTYPEEEPIVYRRRWNGVPPKPPIDMETKEQLSDAASSSKDDAPEEAPIVYRRRRNSALSKPLPKLPIDVETEEEPRDKTSSKENRAFEEEEPIVYRKRSTGFMPTPRSLQLGKSSKAPAKVDHAIAGNQKAAAPDTSETPDAWQDKLTIGATECVWDHVNMTAPPFPFKQRWDKRAGTEIFAAIQEEDESNKVEKRKREEEPERRQESETAEEPEDTVLDYGEDIVTKETKGWNEDDDGEKEEALPEPTGGDDTVPPLPSNLLTLPPLLRSCAVPNAVIVFKRMGLMPDAVGVSCRYYTARILRTADTVDGDTQLVMRLAKRDQIALQKEHKNSVWNKFTGSSLSPVEEEIQTGIYKTNFLCLVQAKLLVPA